MENPELIELSKYRFNKSIDNINIAKSLFDDGKYSFAQNRAYYSIFDAIRAVNALDNFDSSKHSGVIAFFNCHYIKTNVFDFSLSKTIKIAYELEEKSDYEDFYEATKEETLNILNLAASFLETIKEYLKTKGVLD